MPGIIPVFDPRGPTGERAGFVRAGSWSAPPSSRSGPDEKPGYTMWAGPRVVVIHAAFPGVCPEHLRIDVEGTRLAFTIPPRPLSPGGASDRRRANARSRAFRCTVELPYEVDTEQAEVQKEHGWISAVLRKKDPDSAGCRNARGEGDTIRKTTGKKSAFTQPLCAEQGRRPA